MGVEKKKKPLLSGERGAVWGLRWGIGWVGGFAIIQGEGNRNQLSGEIADFTR